MKRYHSLLFMRTFVKKVQKSMYISVTDRLYNFVVFTARNKLLGVGGEGELQISPADKPRGKEAAQFKIYQLVCLKGFSGSSS